MRSGDSELSARAPCVPRRAGFPRIDPGKWELAPAPANCVENTTTLSLKQTEQPFEVAVLFFESRLELPPFERVGVAKDGDLEFDHRAGIALDRPNRERSNLLRVPIVNFDGEGIPRNFFSHPSDRAGPVKVVLVPLAAVTTIVFAGSAVCRRSELAAFQDRPSI